MSGPRRGGDVVVAHAHASGNRDEPARSEVCACCCCLETFPPSEVVGWIRPPDVPGSAPTASCPRCGVDSVLGPASGSPVSEAAFLRRRHDHWLS